MVKWLTVTVGVMAVAALAYMVAIRYLLGPFVQ